MSGPKCFVHLSDIHFGQERGGSVIYHNDVKDQVIRKVRGLAAERAATAQPAITGIIVTGDIAYSGLAAEYVVASDWLRRLAAAAGCAETDVQVVPGNHDIDRNRISTSAALLIDQVIANGQAGLDACLAKEMDREVLYERFADYRPFAYGYGCLLDQEGGRAGEKRFDLAPGRTLCFSGLNSALLCKKKDEPGELFLGARQIVVSDEDGVAHVVLSHHPLHWFSDQTEAAEYLRARASVFLSGHEHEASWNVDLVEGEPRFLSIAAGALIPPKASDKYNYAFNLIEFSLSEDGGGMDIAVHPYCWDRANKRFTQDDKMFEGAQLSSTFTVRCPCFHPSSAPAEINAAPSDALTAADVPRNQEDSQMVTDHRFPALRLRFFQKLGAMQRLRVLDDLGLLPAGAASVPNMTFERLALERLRTDSKQVDRLAAAIDEHLNAAKGL